VKVVILTNAAGGIKKEFTQGRLVVISDHINLQGANPLSGPNADKFGPRFPDMTNAYDKKFRELTLAADDASGSISVKASTPHSPAQFETPAGNPLSSALSAPIWSGCPPFPKLSPRATPAFTPWASLALPTLLPVFSTNRLITTKCWKPPSAPNPVHRLAPGRHSPNCFFTLNC